MSDDFSIDDDVISAYSSEQATEDGILLDIRKVNPEWERGIFSHVTTNLLHTGGYLNEDKSLNIPNLLDLLNQSIEIVRRKSENFTKHDWFFDGKIKLPSGSRQQVYIEQNETGKYTILLPEDH